jgi:hypothetical protein
VDNQFDKMAVERGSEGTFLAIIPPGPAIQLRSSVHEVRRRGAFRERAVSDGQRGSDGTWLLALGDPNGGG